MLNFKYNVDQKKIIILTFKVISVKYDSASLACLSFKKPFTEHLLKLRVIVID